MKYSMYYYRKSFYKNKIDELIIIYKEKSIHLIDFMETRPQEQRVVLDITALENPEECIDIFAEAAKLHPSLALKMSAYQLNDDDLDKLKELNIPFFYDKYIYTWDELNSIIKKGVSDVYITNEFAFKMDKIANHCHKNQVNVRVFPNVAQSTALLGGIDELTKFFIRPEDVDIYEPYVDYMELFGNPSTLDFCYKIYQQKTWFGLLNQLIIGYDGDAYNREMSNMFGLYRTKCGKICSYSGCSICHRFADISKKMGDAELGLQYSNPPMSEEEFNKIIEESKGVIGKYNELKVDETDLSYESENIVEKFD